MKSKQKQTEVIRLSRKDRVRLVRAYQTIGEFLKQPVVEGNVAHPTSSTRRQHMRPCTRADFIRVAAEFEKPFTQEDISEKLKARGFRYVAKTPIDAIRTRLNKDPLFKTHKSTPSIPRAHFLLNKKIARLVLPESVH